MSDLEKFIEIYESVGIILPVIENEENKVLHIEKSFTDENEKIDGYYGFYTDIVFDKNGKFVKQEIYE